MPRAFDLGNCVGIALDCVERDSDGVAGIPIHQTPLRGFGTWVPIRFQIRCGPTRQLRPSRLEPLGTSLEPRSSGASSSLLDLAADVPPRCPGRPARVGSSSILEFPEKHPELVPACVGQDRGQLLEGRGAGRCVQYRCPRCSLSIPFARSLVGRARLDRSVRSREHDLLASPDEAGALLTQASERRVELLFRLDTTPKVGLNLHGGEPLAFEDLLHATDRQA